MSPPSSQKQNPDALHNEPSSDRISSPILSSPQILQPSRLPSDDPATQDRSPLEIVGKTFSPFDHQASLVQPFMNETARDTAFEQALSAMLLDSIIETHAWAAARPKHESQTAAQKYEQKISEVMNVEREQEKTRERLNHFVTQMKTALAALTGISSI